MTDELVNGLYRGWADRVADVLSYENPNFRYANLAIRGKLLPQVVADQIPDALKMIETNTLLSFHAGANDVIRPNYDAKITLPAYAKAVRELSKSGANLMLFTVMERTDRTGRAQTYWENRFKDFNKQVRELAEECGAILVEVMTFMIPWFWRRVRGKSSGDGRVAKYPELRAWP